MKKCFLALLVLIISLQANASPSERDTSDYSRFFNNFNISVQWFEIGGAFPLKERNRPSFSNGLNEYMGQSKGEVAFAALGLGLYFRDLIGFEVIFINYSHGHDGDEFNQYLANKYPNHYIPNFDINHNYSIGGAGLRVCYRQHFKHFFIEPKLQVCFNGYRTNNESFRLKEIGSNQFVQYNITKENQGPENSYHVILNATKRLDPFKIRLKFEVGLKAEFMISPITQTITMTEQPYGMGATTYSETFTANNSAFVFSVTGKMFITNKSAIKKPYYYD